MYKNMEILRAAHDAWLSGATFRENRERYKRFTYGDQWSDMVDDHQGGLQREGTLMFNQGHRLQTNNLIRQLVKAIVGRYRNLCADGAVYDTAPGSLHARNRLPDLDARALEEFVISGTAVQRITWETRPAGAGVWIDNVDPRAFFVNKYYDPRGFDIDLIGMLHRMTLPEIINRFGRDSAARAAELTRIFTEAAPVFAEDCGFGATTAASVGFFDTGSAGRHRVVEVWTLDSRPVKSGRGRLHLEFVWRQRWLAPDGTVLLESDSPYAHRSHPFAVKLYPLTDGEVHSFVEDVIDQQKSINRLVVLTDTMLATSAKGTLLYPVQRLPKGVTLRDIATMWSAPGAVVPLAGAGEMPTSLVTNTAGSGVYEALALQLKLLGDVSGLSDALLGRNVSASTGTEMYEAQVRNASIALADIMETFISFTTERNDKVKKCK